MGDSSLLEICALAFAVVFGLLGIQALVMYLVTVAFPEVAGAEAPERVVGGAPQVDAAVVAAIATAVTTMIPGARVTSVREDRS